MTIPRMPVSFWSMLDWRLPGAKRRRVRHVAALVRGLEAMLRAELERGGRDVQRAILEIGPALDADPVARELPRALLIEYLDALQLGIVRDRFRDWTQLRQYARGYRGAPIELIRLALGGDPAAPRDSSLAEATVITTVLLNLRTDIQRGRLFLPEQDFLLHGARAEDVVAGRMTPELAALVDVYTSRAAGLYENARQAAMALPHDGSRSWALGWIARWRAMLARIQANPARILEG